MNILELLQADGFIVTRVASTNGGEYHGPCIFCGGRDRFLVWPEQGEDGRWWCRQCGRSGDTIQYLRDYRRMSFIEAAQFVGKQLNSSSPSLSGRRTTRSKWSPRETTPPTDLWQNRARRLVEASERDLFLPYHFAQKMLGWLKERRGLSEETIKKYRLGLVPIDRWESPEQWGLDPVLKEDGTPKKIWIPRGLTIPLCQDGNILRIRIRRPKMDLKSEKDARYYLLRGSDTPAMVLGQNRDVFVVVESELDAILLFQEAGDLTGVISLGNAQARPDKEAMEALGHSKLILLALDADEAGVKEAWGWWLNHFPQAKRWPPIEGKDPGDMVVAGIDLRAWVEVGIDEYGGKNQERDEGPGNRTHAREMEAELIPSRAQGKDLPKQISPAPPEGITITCFECPHFIPVISPNPRQAWGHCGTKHRGRFGAAMACEAMLTSLDAPGETMGKISDE